jgi:hypothetical protein
VTVQFFLARARSGRVMAHVLEPPGFGRWYEDRAALEAELVGDVAEHLAWVRTAGESTPETVARTPVDEVEVQGNFESGDDVGTFAPDLVSVTSPEIERYLRLARRAYDDLLTLAASVPAAVAMQPPRPGKRSFDANLSHVARAQLWYMTRVIDDPDAVGMPPALDRANQRIDAAPSGYERVRVASTAYEAFVREVPEPDRDRVFHPTWFCDVPSESWTVRKALRRSIEHCREHTWVAQRTLRELGTA